MRKMIFMILLVLIASTAFAEEGGLAINTLVLSQPVDSLCNRLGELEMIQLQIERIEKERIAERKCSFSSDSSGPTGAIAFIIFCFGAYYWVVR